MIPFKDLVAPLHAGERADAVPTYLLRLIAARGETVGPQGLPNPLGPNDLTFVANPGARDYIGSSADGPYEPGTGTPSIL